MTDSAEIAALREDVAELKALVNELVFAWNTARGVVKFVKVIGSIATAVTAVWALLKIGHTIK